MFAKEIILFDNDTILVSISYENIFSQIQLITSEEQKISCESWLTFGLCCKKWINLLINKNIFSFLNFQQPKLLCYKKMENSVPKAYLDTRMELGMNRWKTSLSALGLDMIDFSLHW